MQTLDNEGMQRVRSIENSERAFEMCMQYVFAKGLPQYIPKEYNR